MSRLFLLCVYQFHSHITCTILNRRTEANISGWLTLSLALLGVSTLATGGLLQVVGLGPTTTAQSVRLVPALTERWCPLRLKGNRLHRSGTIPEDLQYNFKLIVLSQHRKMNHRKSFVQTFVFWDITDKTHVAAITTCWMWGIQYYSPPQKTSGWNPPTV